MRAPGGDTICLQVQWRGAISRVMRKLVTISTLIMALVLTSVVFGQPGTSFLPDAKNYDAWLKFIRPSKDELSFERVGWRSQFWPAVVEARSLGRPILLWTMNGHPLGCT